jgi:hypothetical protein
MHAATGRTNGFGAQAFQDALEPFKVANFEFDFGFVRHGISSSGENGE